ncbi:hypothetical protein [Rhodococcus sp. MTM3W5.2]|uniref:hypothetical protein n=1 Tax=Rhodococcus sp. MTM3W5.2 TaxID=1805827 RepID=UPI0011AEB0E9|nr:hypothetical protein [Rhodococcus sp. MTM3W5.2]
MTPRTRHTDAWSSLMIVLALLVIGLVLIAVYAFATSGTHLSYASVGMLVAAAALAAGALIGFVLGVPKAVSSGETRLRASDRGAGDAAAVQAADGGAGLFPAGM